VLKKGSVYCPFLLQIVNIPFAGRAMTFKITIKSIRDATVDELGSGLSADNLTGYPQVR